MASQGVEETAPKKDYLISSRTYYLLNNLITVILPGLGTLYFALAGIWNLPSPEQVVGTIVAVSTFLGLFLKISQRSYDNSESRYEGSIDVQDTGDKLVYSLNLNSDPAELKHMDTVSFKVNSSLSK
jgi:Putative phage holin Dp-1